MKKITLFWISAAIMISSCKQMTSLSSSSSTNPLPTNGAVTSPTPAASSRPTPTPTPEVEAVNSDGYSLEGVLVPRDATEGVTTGSFGSSVAVTGNQAIVGRPADSTSITYGGSVYIFTNTNGVWTETQKITSPAPFAGEYFGDHISADGSILVIHGELDYVYEQDVGGHWNYSGAINTGSATQSYSSKLFQVSGSSIIIGGLRLADPLSTTVSYGAVEIFQKSGSQWVVTKTLENPVFTSGSFGQSFNVSGNLMAIGDNVNSWGYLFLYHWNGSDWIYDEELIGSTQDSTFGEQGSFQISGLKLLAGDVPVGNVTGPFGKVRAYDYGTSGWSANSTLASSLTDIFGQSLSTDGDLAFISEWGLYDPDVSVPYGRYDVFQNSNGSWSQSPTVFRPVDGSIAITATASGNRVFFQTFHVFLAGQKDGAIYVFGR